LYNESRFTVHTAKETNVDIMSRTRPTAGIRPPTAPWWGRSTALLVAAVAAVALGVAACGGSSSAPPGAAGAGSGGGSTGDSAKLVKYAQCMRENGVPGFPDPVNGQLRLTVTPGGGLDPNSPQFKAAQQACKSLEPPGLQNGSGQNTQQQSQGLKFASCMREHGVANFPDPKDGLFTGSADLDPNSQQFQSALAACRKLAPGGVGGGGQ